MWRPARAWRRDVRRKRAKRPRRQAGAPPPNPRRTRPFAPPARTTDPPPTDSGRAPRTDCLAVAGGPERREAMSRLAPRPATHLATPARSFVISVALLVLLLVGSTGCNTRAGRPDTEVAKFVEQEERRLSHSGAIASVDLETFDLSSVGMAIEAMALVMVGGDPSRAAPPPTASAPIGAAEG